MPREEVAQQCEHVRHALPAHRCERHHLPPLQLDDDQRAATLAVDRSRHPGSVDRPHGTFDVPDQPTPRPARIARPRGLVGADEDRGRVPRQLREALPQTRHAPPRVLLQGLRDLQPLDRGEDSRPPTAASAPRHHGQGHTEQAGPSCGACLRARRRETAGARPRRALASRPSAAPTRRSRPAAPPTPRPRPRPPCAAGPQPSARTHPAPPAAPACARCRTASRRAPNRRRPRPPPSHPSASPRSPAAATCTPGRPSARRRDPGPCSVVPLLVSRAPVGGAPPSSTAATA